MWCHVPSTLTDDAAKARNDEIELQLQRDSVIAKNNINILVVDSGDSGRNIIKRMKLIHHGGYSDSERDSFKEIIFHNTIQSMRTVLEAMPSLDLSLKPNNEVRRTYLLSLPIGSQDTNLQGESLPSDISDAIRILWHDPGVREAVRRSNEFQLNEEAVYYFNAIDRMSHPGYLPTDQDILSANVKTTGIVETTFQVGELAYRILDMTGQRSERKKWLHCFENVTALLFCVSMSDYDVLELDATPFHSALTLFDSICNSRWFIKTSIILFLNDIDKFAEKLPHSPLGDYFPDYTGGDNYDAACDYILHRFVSLNQSASAKQIYAHYTCETDARQLKYVLSAVQDILLQIHLRGEGLLDD